VLTIAARTADRRRHSSGQSYHSCAGGVRIHRHYSRDSTKCARREGRGAAEPARLIAAQITAVLADFKIDAIKTGLLPGAVAVRAWLPVPYDHRRPIVVDV